MVGQLFGRPAAICIVSVAVCALKYAQGVITLVQMQPCVDINRSPLVVRIPAVIAIGREHGIGEVQATGGT